MSELACLTRLLVQRNQKIATVFLGLIAITITIAALGYSLPGDSELAGEVGAAMVCMVAGCAALWGVLLLDFYRASDVTGKAGMYEAWLLRSPIASWKLALVPLAAKAVWLTGLLTLLVWFICLAESTPFSVRAVFSVSFPLIAVGTVACVILWRPVRHDWERAMWLIAGMIVTIGYIVCAAWLSGRGFTAWQRVVGAAVLFFGTGASVWQAIRSIELARTHSLGLISDTAAKPSRVLHGIPVERVFQNSARALTWHDRRRGWLHQWPLFLLVSLVTSTFLFLVFLPAVIFVVAGSVMAFAFTSVFCGRAVEPAIWDSRSSLPEYLIASPLSVRQLAWGRALLVVRWCVISALVAVTLLLVAFSIQSVRPDALNLWGLDRVEWLKPAWRETPGVLRLTGAFGALALATVTTQLGFGLNNLSITATGRNHVGAIVSAIAIVVIAGGLIGTCWWFVNLSSWDAVQQSWENAKMWLMFVALGLLFAKLTLAGAFAIRGSWQGDLLAKDILVVVGLWLVAVVGVGGMISMAAPYSIITLPIALLGTGLVLPIASVLGLPAAVRWNLHR
ncbi:MAG: hypothetical protein AAGA03_01145 [Planctomycetota bacterium]